MKYTYKIIARTIISRPASIRYTAPLKDSAVAMNIVLFNMGLKVIKTWYITSFKAKNVPEMIRNREKLHMTTDYHSLYQLEWCSQKEHGTKYILDTA